MPEMLFYTIREYGITVCLIKAVGGFWARGVSICSKRDQFWKARGREIAQGRAMKILMLASEKEPVWHACPILRSDVYDRITDTLGSDFKAAMSCEPANHVEERLLQARNWV